MAVGLVMRFPNMTRGQYEAAAALMGINTQKRTSRWPPGLLSHAAGPTSDGAFVTMDVWESRAAHARFLTDRLGVAVQKLGITSIPDLTWIEIACRAPTDRA